MRVTKKQIIDGLAEYISNEITPKLGNDRALQIIASIALNAAMSNNKLVNAALENDIVRTLLEDDGSGTYEIGGVTEAMRSAIEQYGGFPVRVPAIPFISPHEVTLMLGTSDVETMRRMIENAV